MVKIRSSANSMTAPLNADAMLKAEIKLLDKIFSNKQFKKSHYLKGKAYSNRYFCAAWAYKESGDIKNALKCIFKSITLNPFYFFCKRKHIGLLVKIILLGLKHLLRI